MVEKPEVIKAVGDLLQRPFLFANLFVIIASGSNGWRNVSFLFQPLKHTMLNFQQMIV